ncbi:hypothetical protein b23_0216 [Synechococcus phage B23]|nr:hypothetical protein b23_0216 [Synechococcus phage B23]
MHRISLTEHLKQRHLNIELHRPIICESEYVATFLIYNLSGQIVGYQKYRPQGCKKTFNCAEKSKYYTYRKLPTVTIWGVESLKFHSKCIFLTEGIFGAARMTNIERSALAVLSNDCPKDYVNWLQMLNRPIVSVCDNDSAGKKLSKFGNYVEIVPDIKDLGESSDDYVSYLIDKYD